MNFLKDPRTNWKYILVVIFVAIISGGILGCQWWKWRQTAALLSVEKSPEEPIVPVSAKGEFSLEKVKLHTTPDDVLPGNSNMINFSNDGKHFAYEAEKDGKHYLMVDGVLVGPYESVSFDQFCSTGGKYVYTAKQGGKWVIYSNQGQIAGPFESYGSYNAVRTVFSSDCSYLAVEVSDSVTIYGPDGEKKLYVYDEIRYLQFSPNGNSFAFSAREGNREFMVINGKEEKKYDAIFEFTFSDDGERHSYIALPEGYKGSRIYVVDGEEQKRYSSVQDFTFSPNADSFVYAATTGSTPQREWFVVRDGEVIDGPFQEVLDFDFAFSPDGKRLAYQAQTDWGLDVICYIVDGAEQEKYIRMWDFKFSPDSQRFAYVAWGQYVKGNFIVIDGKRDGLDYTTIFTEDAFPNISPTFSPDSQKFVYVGKNTGEPEITLEEFAEETEKMEKQFEEGKITEEEMTEMMEEMMTLLEKASGKEENFVIMNGQQNGPYSGNISDLRFTQKNNLVFVESEKYFGGEEWADLVYLNFEEVGRFEIVFQLTEDPTTGMVGVSAREGRDLFWVPISE